jgi:hypothetical protein
MRNRFILLTVFLTMLFQFYTNRAQCFIKYVEEIPQDSISVIHWSLDVELTAPTVTPALVSLGVRQDASSGYDPQYDYPSPPNPPSDFIEAYFPHTGGNWPEFLGMKYSKDIRNPVDPSWELVIETTFPSVEVNLNWDTSVISVLPKNYNLMLKDSVGGVTINMRSVSYYSFQYFEKRTLTIYASSNDTTFFNIKSGWNIISIPCFVKDYKKQTLLPFSVSNAFSFDGMYTAQDTLTNGKGYWIKYNNPDIIKIPGLSIPSLQIQLKKGWNIIGSIGLEIPPPADNIIVSEFYEYDNGYKIATALMPGKGYWVKAANEGTIYLGQFQKFKKINNDR